MLNRSTGLDRFDLERCTDVGEHRGTEGQRLGMVLLPSLILGTKIEGAGVLEIGGKYDGLVTGFAGELDTEIPSVEGNKDKV